MREYKHDKICIEMFCGRAQSSAAVTSVGSLCHNFRNLQSAKTQILGKNIQMRKN